MSNSRSFWPAFQKRWAAVLCEQTEGLGVWSENMTQALRRGILEVPNSAEAHVALAQLNIRLSRLESVQLAAGEAPLDGTARALFIGYGAAILSAPVPMAAATPAAKIEAENVAQYGELSLQLDHLCQWLRALKLAPRRIFSLEDFDSQIIGRALARQLDIEVAVADGDGFTHSKSLVVSADNRSLLASPLRTVFPAQVLYSFNLYREGGVIVPDVAGLASPGLIMPWHNERLSSRKIASVVERISSALATASTTASTTPPSLGLTNQLLDASPSVLDDDWQQRLEFYRARREWLTAGNSCYSRAFMLPETN